MAGAGLSANVSSVLAWTILPSFLANTLLALFYRLLPSTRPAVPARASPADLAAAQERSQAHHRRARVLLVAAYLAYSVLSVYVAQQRGAEQNYYALLGIDRSVVEAEGAPAVKSHWRRLARVYHPDKVGKDGEGFFVLLRQGVEVLEHDGRRWAYERFGPGVTEWGKLVTPREFLVKGAVHSAVWWAMAAGSLAVFSFFRKSERRFNFWRYLSLLLCVSLEFHLLLRSTPSPTFSLVFPSRLPYEHVALLRQLFISVSMAMSQLAPLLSPPSPSPSSSSTEEAALAAALADADHLRPLLQRLAALSTTTEREVAALQRLELRPLVPDHPAPGSSASDVEKRTRREVEDKMVRVWEDLQIKGASGTAGVWTEAVRRGRAREAREKGGMARSAEGGKNVEAPLVVVVEAEHDAPPKVDDEATVPTLETAAIPPPVTLLASPPASPKLGFPLSSIDAPPSSPHTSTVELPREEYALARAGEEDGALKPPERNAAHRLPTPPPED
ncbi:hypothetical protein JCM8208_003275 [Rhodotorula glutinis]